MRKIALEMAPFPGWDQRRNRIAKTAFKRLEKPPKNPIYSITWSA
jgi:hypothetical protein